MFKKDKNYISVALSDESLKLAQVKMSGSGLEVMNVAKRDIKGISEEELPKIIKSVLHDWNIKSADLICAIPSSMTTTKNIEIPSMDPEEIKSIINLQAGRHTPFSREEIRPAPLLSGKDILALGYPEGPLVGKILRQLEEAQLERKVSTKEEALQFVHDWARTPPKTPSS